jgi:flavin-dependent dehydrogenase
MSRRKHYDVAIIGLGTMGSFAAVELARRGFSVCQAEQRSEIADSFRTTLTSPTLKNRAWRQIGPAADWFQELCW